MHRITSSSYPNYTIYFRYIILLFTSIFNTKDTIASESFASEGEGRIYLHYYINPWVRPITIICSTVSLVYFEINFKDQLSSNMPRTISALASALPSAIASALPSARPSFLQRFFQLQISYASLFISQNVLKCSQGYVFSAFSILYYMYR